jgi:HlyD family secretion protein
VQPAEQGIVKEILVREGEAVKAGQVLARMDPVLTDADLNAVRAEFLTGGLRCGASTHSWRARPCCASATNPPELFARVSAQHVANVRAYESALAQEKVVLEKARHDLAGAQATRAKLEQVLPHYIAQEKAFEKLTQDGFAGRIMYTDKQRERIEKEQDLNVQEFVIRASASLIEQSEKRVAQIGADYRRQLQTERADVGRAVRPGAAGPRQAIAPPGPSRAARAAGRRGQGPCHAYRGHGRLAGHDPDDPGAEGDRLIAEVWVSNEDVGFVRQGQKVKLKLAAFQFQKYGLLQGKVLQVTADASEAPAGAAHRAADRPRPAVRAAFFSRHR